MHVAVRETDQPGRDAARVDLQGIGVVGCRPPDRRQLVRESLSARPDRIKRWVTCGFMLGPRKMTGPAPSAMSPCCFLSIVGQSVAWVTSTAIPTCGSSESTRSCTPQANLFLHSRNSKERAIAAQWLSAPPQASMTTQSPLRLSMPGELAKLLSNRPKAQLQSHRIANSTRLARVLPGPARRCPATALRLHDLLAFVFAEQVDRLT